LPIPETFAKRFAAATTQQQRLQVAYGYLLYALRHHGRLTNPRPESEQADREEACRLASDYLLDLCETLNKKLGEP
jgi:hypothetical protein